MSYDMMTPSAARGVVEAIYWKPESRWQVDSISVLKPIRFVSVRRNEVKDKIGAGTVMKAMREGKGELSYCVDEGDDRQQHATLMLRDVGYVIEAHFDIVGGPDNRAKHVDQFNKRAQGPIFYAAIPGLPRVCRAFCADRSACGR